jgi:hypothetical protein
MIHMFFSPNESSKSSTNRPFDPTQLVAVGMRVFDARPKRVICRPEKPPAEIVSENELDIVSQIFII